MKLFIFPREIRHPETIKDLDLLAAWEIAQERGPWGHATQGEGPWQYWEYKVDAAPFTGLLKPEKYFVNCNILGAHGFFVKPPCYVLPENYWLQSMAGDVARLTRTVHIKPRWRYMVAWQYARKQAAAGAVPDVDKKKFIAWAENKGLSLTQE